MEFKDWPFVIWRTRWGRQLDLHSTQTPDISTQNTRKHNRFHTCKHISPEPYRSPHLRTVHPNRQLQSPDMDTLFSLLSRHSAVLSFFFPCPGRRKHHAFWYKTKDVQSLLVLLCHHATVTLNYTSLSSLNLHTRLLFLTYIPAKSIDRSVAHMSAHLQAVFFQCCLLPPGIWLPVLCLQLLYSNIISGAGGTCFICRAEILCWLPSSQTLWRTKF